MNRVWSYDTRQRFLIVVLRYTLRVLLLRTLAVPFGLLFQTFSIRKNHS